MCHLQFGIDVQKYIKGKYNVTHEKWFTLNCHPNL